MSIRFIVSTRSSKNEFFSKSLLVRSLEGVHSSTTFALEPVFAAKGGLAQIYNAAIDRSELDDILVFVHDDVYIDDWYIGARLLDALNSFDVVGIAGATLRDSNQAAWWGTEINGVLTELPNRSCGAVKHVKYNFRSRFAHFLLPPGVDRPLRARAAWHECWIEQSRGAYRLNLPATRTRLHARRRVIGGGGGILECFGPAPATATLLDGVFIAARSRTLKASKVYFDPRFHYHFYDLDFSRQCEVAGLRLGVWPIAVTHASIGSYGDGWQAGKASYFKKWGS